MAKDNHYYINIVSILGQLISSHPIIFPKEISPFRRISPKFSPLDEQLIFSTGKQLFTLSYEGEVENISLLLDEPMGSPIFHPNGERTLVVKGHYDADIVSMPIFSDYQQEHPLEKSYSVIQRSTTGEYDMMLQPRGQLSAFVSKRTGVEQVWVMDGSNIRQLTTLPKDSYITGIDWANNGNSLLVNANHQLSRVYLDGRVESFPLANSVDQLFQWDSEKNRALAKVQINGISTFTEINLNTLRTLHAKSAQCNLGTENGKWQADLYRYT